MSTCAHALTSLTHAIRRKIQSNNMMKVSMDHQSCGERERERESRKGISSLLHPVGSMHVHTRQAHEGPAWHRQAESKALLVAMFLHCTVRQNMNVKMTAQQTYKIGHSFLGSAI